MNVVLTFASRPRVGPTSRHTIQAVDPGISCLQLDNDSSVRIDPQDCTEVLREVVRHGDDVVRVDCDIACGRVVQLLLLVDVARFVLYSHQGRVRAEEFLVELARSIWREARVPSLPMPCQPSVDLPCASLWKYDKYPLFAHQCSSLGRMHDIESHIPGRITYTGNLRISDEWYLDTERECFTRDPSVREALLVGGLCADGAGTGKTATVLHLVAASLSLSPPPPLPSGNRYPSQATLILLPVNLVSQWQREIAKFLNPGLTVLTITQMRDLKCTLADLVRADIVISTFQFLRSSKSYQDMVETALGGRTRSRSSLSVWARQLNHSEPVLEAIEWRRIVVDEIHQVFERPRDLRHLRLLTASVLWGLTATPVLDTEQAQHLYVFLEREKAHHPNLLASLVHKSIVCSTGPSTTLPDPEMVRIRLPDDEQRRIEPTTTEDLRSLVEQCTFMDVSEEDHEVDGIREQFRKMQERDVGILRERIQGYEQNISSFTELLHRLDSTTQMSHVESSRMRDIYIEDIERLQNMKAKDERKIQELTNAESFVTERLVALRSQNETCGICMERICGVITPCAHLFCSQCVRRHVEEYHTCPTCRTSMHTVDLRGVPVINRVGSKMMQIGERILSLGTEPVILFVQWKSMLKGTKAFLRSIGVKVLSLDGSVSRRSATLDEFHSGVLLLCLEECFAGLHLVHVRHVLFAHALVGDVPTVKLLESQAIARCVRHGQTEKVTVTSFVVADCEEERLWLSTRDQHGR